VKLFIVLCAAAMTPNAPYRQSVTACEVSTFPATTAAGKIGSMTEPLRSMISDRFETAVVER